MSDFFKRWRYGQPIRYIGTTSTSASDDGVGSFQSPLWPSFSWDFSGSTYDPEFYSIPSANNFFGDKNVIALWKFNGSNLNKDDSNNNNNLIIALGTPTSSSERREGSSSLRLPGNAAYYISDQGLSSNFPTKSGDTKKVFSVCFWYKVYSSCENCKVLSKYSNNKRSWAILPGGGSYSARFFWGYNGGLSHQVLDTEFNIDPGQWYHFSVLVDGVNKICKFKIWSDYSFSFVVDKTFYPTYELEVTNASFYIGAEDGNYYPINGYLDETIIFDKILTDQEIYQIITGSYGFGLPPPSGGPEPSGAIYDDNSCIAWFRFEPNQLGVESVHRRDLSFVGTPISVQGKEGNGAIKFDGSCYGYCDSDFLWPYFPCAIEKQLKQGSVCFWINITQSVQYTKVFSFYDVPGNRIVFAICPCGLNDSKFSVIVGIYGGYSQEVVNFDYSLQTNRWYHVAVSWMLGGPDGITDSNYPHRGIKVIIWDDSTESVVLNQTKLCAHAIDISSDPDFIIGSEHGGYNKFKGILDDMLIFARVLDENEISSIRNFSYEEKRPFNNYSGSKAVARWEFKEGSTEDSIGNNDLTAVGSPFFSSHFNPFIESSSYVYINRDQGLQYLTIDDSSLSSGFPFKSSDTKKKISVGMWYLVTSDFSYDNNYTLISKYSTSNNKRSFLVYFYNNYLCFNFGKNDGTLSSVYRLNPSGLYTIGDFRFLGFAIDGADDPRLFVYNYSIRSGIWTKWLIHLKDEVGVFDSPLQIGTFDSSLSNTFKGFISDVVIFDDILSEIDFWSICQGYFPPPLSGAGVYSTTLHTELIEKTCLEIDTFSQQTEANFGPSLINIFELRQQAEIKTAHVNNGILNYLLRQQTEVAERGVVESGISVNDLKLQIEIIPRTPEEPEIPHEYPKMIIKRGRGYGRSYIMDVENGNIVLKYKE